MTGLLHELGAVGMGLVLLVTTTTVYVAGLQFRPDASWYSDLARLRNRITSSKEPAATSRRTPLPMAHNLWPVCEVGPRMWRWPLNLTRLACAVIWSRIGSTHVITPTGHVLRTRVGLVWSLLRLSWYPATGLGALAAIVQALTLVLLVTVPVKALLFVFDTATVIRGGIPPATLPMARATTSSATEDWDQALADLLDTEPATDTGPFLEHGIRLGPDGQALDPAEQFRLDQARQTADREWLDNDRQRHAELLDRMERLNRRDQQ